jgi:hypothetical protein
MIEKNKDINKAENTLYSSCGKKSSIFCQKKTTVNNGGLNMFESSFKSRKCELALGFRVYDLTDNRCIPFLMDVNVHRGNKRLQMATSRLECRLSLRFNHINRCLPVQGRAGVQTDAPAGSFISQMKKKESSHGR